MNPLNSHLVVLADFVGDPGLDGGEVCVDLDEAQLAAPLDQLVRLHHKLLNKKFFLIFWM